MSATVVWSGLEEFKLALRQIPVTLHDQAIAIVDRTTEDTATELLQNYPEGATGNLRAGVKVVKTFSDFGVIDEVKSLSPHAHLWENGTQNRETLEGWNRGRILPAVDRGLQTLRSIAPRRRRTQMWPELMALLASVGFDLSGTPE